MNYNEIRKNENKGFSLIELIVVVAIMAVLVAVLAPSLLQYVERSRAQKDDSAMGEVANAVMVALADQDVYDECLYFSAYGNVSCYIDEAAEDTVKDEKVITKVATNDSAANSDRKDQYTFDDDARINDEVMYRAAGNMRGLTITFESQQDANKTTYKLSEGIINKFLGGANAGAQASHTEMAEDRSTNADVVAYVNGTAATPGKLGVMTTGANKTTAFPAGYTALYNRLRSIVDEEITLTSQTYRNSDYTIFIRMGTTGGKKMDAQDAVVVYGQWNGTNLSVGSTPVA